MDDSSLTREARGLLLIVLGWAIFVVMDEATTPATTPLWWVAVVVGGLAFAYHLVALFPRGQGQ